MARFPADDPSLWSPLEAICIEQLQESQGKEPGVFHVVSSEVRPIGEASPSCLRIQVTSIEKV
jgi:hypothetical protein